MVVTEGVARTLNPNLDIWRSGEPIVRAWIERKLGPLGIVEKATNSLGSLLQLGLKLPDILDDAHKITRRMAEMAKAEPQKPPRWHSAALLVAVAALLVIAATLVLK